MLWPLQVLPVGALQLHKNGEKISVAAFGQRKIFKEMEPSICQRSCQEKCLCSSGRLKKGQQCFGGVKRESEAEGPFFHVKMTHSGGDAVTLFLRV